MNRASPSSMTRVPLSACIITLNEADRIDDCLASLSFCDEIVVLDSGSSDDTCARAAASGARVLKRAFEGYRTQKNHAVQCASHDWVLCIDADERVSPELRAAIERARAEGFRDAAGYKFQRANDYFGRFLRHGNASPDRVLRLFDRRQGAFGGHEIHESVRVRGPVQRLAGALVHYPYRSFGDHLHKARRYARLMAEAEHAAGKRARLFDIVLHPWWRFVRGYLLRLGFLDGWRGLIYAYVRSIYVREKYMTLWLLNRGHRVV